nr:MAG TPA: hypothetical protein [Caudoviricetes sp.]
MSEVNSLVSFLRIRPFGTVPSMSLTTYTLHTTILYFKLLSSPFHSNHLAVPIAWRTRATALSGICIIFLQKPASARCHALAGKC